MTELSSLFSKIIKKFLGIIQDVKHPRTIDQMIQGCFGEKRGRKMDIDQIHISYEKSYHRNVKKISETILRKYEDVYIYPCSAAAKAVVTSAHRWAAIFSKVG